MQRETDLATEKMYWSNEEASNKLEMTEKVSRENDLTDNHRMPNLFLNV